MPDVAYRVTVRGRVTGVGFRFSALAEAAAYPSLKGYVRNANARTVECVIQGEEAEVAAMLAWLRHGPALAEVSDCRVDPIPLDSSLPTFRVTR